MWELALVLHRFGHKWEHRCFSLAGIMGQFNMITDSLREMGFSVRVVGGSARVYDGKTLVANMVYRFVE